MRQCSSFRGVELGLVSKVVLIVGSMVTEANLTVCNYTIAPLGSHERPVPEGSMLPGATERRRNAFSMAGTLFREGRRNSKSGEG